METHNSWCHKLTLNVDKTKAIVFDCKNRDYTTVKTSTMLNNDEKLKCIGVTLYRRLNFRLHCSEILSQLNQKIHLFCKLRKILNTFTALTSYESHILSFFEYGAMFIKCLPQNLKNKIQRL